MKRKLFDEPPAVPDMVLDQTVTVPRGETGYRMEFDDATMELFAQGICPEDVAKRAYDLLGWKREYARQCARELNDVAPLEKATA